MAERDRFGIHGPTGHPVRPGDPALWLILDHSPHELTPLDAVRLGEALTVAGSRAASAAPAFGRGHRDDHEPLIDDVRMDDDR